MTPANKTSGITTDGTHYDFYHHDRPVVVFIHGLGLNRHMWQWQVHPINQQYSVLTYDLIGSGESAAPVRTPSLSMFSTQLAALLNELNIDKAAIFGFSLGGMIARRFAMDHSTRVSALGVLHSAYQRDSTAHNAIQQRVNQAKSEGPLATVEAALARWFSDEFRIANLNTIDFVRESILANKQEIYPQIYQVLVDGVFELVNPVPPINCPTLVMTAEQDYGNSVAMAHQIASEIPNAETVILPGLRHMAMVEAPALFNETLLRYLGKTLPAT